MWTQLHLPPIAAPIWGFDFPVEHRFHVATAHGFLAVDLVPEPAVRVLIDADEFRRLYDPATDDSFEWNGRWYEVNGPNGPAPTLLDLPTGERITGDPQTGWLVITDPQERTIYKEIMFGPVVGDQAYAGFSGDGTYLVMGDAAKVWVFRREA
jgi:hypothetical protein